MKALERIANLLPDTKGYQPRGVAMPYPVVPDFHMQGTPIGHNVTLYPSKDGKVYVDKGYNYNADVHAVVSKCAKKFGQLPWYQYRIKKDERKTWSEYIQLTKDGLTPESVKEAKRMRTKAIEQNIVDSALIKRLNKPNELQTGAQFREQLYGYKLLTGEGNQLVVRNEAGKIIALQIVPKSFLALIGGSSPYHIENFIFRIYGKEIVVPVMDLIMWKFPNYNFDPTTLEHLRGLAPLDAYLLHLQASNEGVIRQVNMNNNQGAAGLLYRKDVTQMPTPEQTVHFRQQINNTINSKDMAGAIAAMSGEYGYIQFGLDADKLKLIEQAQLSMEKLCNVMDVPYAMFKADQTYENKKEAKREFIFDNIAVAAYGLRDEWNNKLVPEYNLDRERDVLDVDVLALPELSQDLKQQVDAHERAWWMTLDEKRLGTGLEPLGTPDSVKVYLPSSLTTLEELNADIGGPLDEEENLLNG